jgi:hypothetical protein
MCSKKKEEAVVVDVSATGMMTVNDQGSKHRVRHLAFGFVAGTVASSIYLFNSCFDEESVVMLSTFNFLFVFLIFPLDGKLYTKMLMLLVGNLLGYVWNRLFSFFASVVVPPDPVFNTLYLILSPFLNLIWIVTYWSLSLTVFSGHKKQEEMVTET